MTPAVVVAQVAGPGLVRSVLCVMIATAGAVWVAEPGLRGSVWSVSGGVVIAAAVAAWVANPRLRGLLRSVPGGVS